MPVLKQGRRYFLCSILSIAAILVSPRSIAGSELVPESLSELAPAEFEARLHALAASVQWRRMIPREVDGPGFFLSPRGASDPEAELRADIEAFRTIRVVGSPAQPAQCAFPERYRFVTKELKLRLPEVACPELEKFLDSFQAVGVSLVFSSAYPNNPGSMFGHTFLRFRSKRSSGLLDGTISFAATVGDEQDILFMIKGVFGGYQGHFTNVPYYVKINEYNNMESRDLVEYVLTFNEAETRSLIRHFWEIERNSWISYYFLDENCGSVLIDALEAVRPDLKIPRHKLYAIPTEVTRAIASAPGLVSEIKFRPSLRRKLNEFIRQLSSPERENFRQIVQDKKAASDLRDAATLDAATLDTTNVYFQYLKQKQAEKFTLAEKARANGFLIQRSQISESSGLARIKVPGEEESRPDLSHHASSLMGDMGFFRGDPFQEVQLRSSLQGLIDHDEGYVPFSEFEFPSATLRWYPGKQDFRLENLNFVSITSLSPVTIYENRMSWRAVVDLRSPKDQGNEANLVGHLEGGAGETFEFIHSRWWSYALLEGYGEAGSTFHLGYRWGPLVNLGSLAKLSRNYEVNLSAKLISDLLQTDRQPFFLQIDLDQAWAVAQDWKVFLNAEQILPSRSTGRSVNEIKSGLALYF